MANKNSVGGTTRIGRRCFLQQGCLIMSSVAVIPTQNAFANAAKEPTATRFGIVTDLHYADKSSSNTRHYRETLRKVDEAAEQYTQDKPDFLVCLGDIIDAADTWETELTYLQRINGKLKEIHDDRHYVLGNHCVSTLSKSQFLAEVEREKSYYSFDRGDVHFVVLDACFRKDLKPYGPGPNGAPWNDANIPSVQVEWLKADLAATSLKTILLIHQRLDVSNNYGIRNGAEIRKIVEESKRVIAVFQGHSHENEYKEIAGIHYCTLQAMVEGAGAQANGFSTVNVSQDGSILVKGYVKQVDYNWPANAKS